MNKVILFVLAVLLASVSGWGDCYSAYTAFSLPQVDGPCYTGAGCGGASSCSYRESARNACASNELCVTRQSGERYYSQGVIERVSVRGDLYYCNQITKNSCASSITLSAYCSYRQYCDTKREADSVYCDYNNKVWDSETGQCGECTQIDSTWRESTCGYSVRKSMYLNVVTTCQRTNCHVNCISREYYAQTCDTTGVDSSITCMGSIDGVNVYLRGASGRVTSCNADGSCAFALQKVALGQCPNPNDPPTQRSSSSGQGEQSSSSSGDDEQSSSSGGEGISSSQQGTSQMQEDWEWLKDSLGAIHQTEEEIAGWTPFISGTYDGVINLNGVAHDINSNLRVQLDLQAETRDKASQTATNTANIDNKLNTTNSLLNDIKNKNWNPTINVNPEVNVTADTSKAPSEILQLMKDGLPNQSDTAGFGAQIDGMMGKIDSLVGNGIPNMNGDSLSNAMSSLKNKGLGSIKDTIGNSAINDSMTTWGTKITDNGYITGQGSDNCPEILTRTWQVRFPIGTGGADINIGPLGVYLCRPVAGMGITFWALCRVILRAMVAIACMIWLYKSVLGIDGGSNEED